MEGVKGVENVEVVEGTDVDKEEWRERVQRVWRERAKKK